MKLILFSSTMLSLCVRGNFRSDQLVEISEHVVGNDCMTAARPSGGVTFLCAHGGVESYIRMKMPGPDCRQDGWMSPQ